MICMLYEHVYILYTLTIDTDVVLADLFVQRGAAYAECPCRTDHVETLIPEGFQDGLFFKVLKPGGLAVYKRGPSPP